MRVWRRGRGGWRSGVCLPDPGEGGGRRAGDGGEEGRGKEGMRGWRIESLELWADPLSAWVCCGE